MVEQMMMGVNCLVQYPMEKTLMKCVHRHKSFNQMNCMRHILLLHHLNKLH